MTKYNPHAPGAKNDSGKIRTGLVLGGFANALLAIAEVGTKGAEKYSPNGWKSVPDGISRYTDALLRHQFADMSGESVDSEWGLLHLAHAAWNALAILELKLCENKVVGREQEEVVAVFTLCEPQSKVDLENTCRKATISEKRLENFYLKRFITPTDVLNVIRITIGSFAGAYDVYKDGTYYGIVPESVLIFLD
jgi:hypothetical protein